MEIKSNELTCLYAHCKNIYVKEGELVEKGKEIAEVGMTGKATRSTFTFRAKGVGKTC